MKSWLIMNLNMKPWERGEARSSEEQNETPVRMEMRGEESGYAGKNWCVNSISNTGYWLLASTHLCAVVCICIQVCAFVFRCIQLYAVAYKCVQLYTSV